MKHPILVLAAATLVTASGAHAQSNVTVYGLMDAGIDNTSHSKAGTTRVTSGGMNTSRWGFRGAEDLGNGLKAVFNLEGGIQIDKGVTDSSSSLFNRHAYVGLEGGFGRVVLGRSYTTAYDFVLPYDPMGYAPSYSWGTSGNATTAGGKFGMTTAFDNLVKYAGQAGNFKFGATYGFGEQAGSTADSARFALGANYDFGPVSVMGTYEQVNGNTVAGGRDKTTVYHLGALYSNGPLKLQAAMRDYKKDPAAVGSADLKGTTYWGGVNYQSSPAVTLTGAVYYMNVKNVAANADADPIMYVGRVKYALSKRTDLYTAIAYSKAKHGLATSLSRDDVGTADSQRGIIAGVQHRF